MLLLDMDGPLADFDGFFWQVVRDHGIETDVDPYPSNQRHRFATSHILDARDRAFVRNMINLTNWFLFLPVMEGAQEGVQTLLDAGVDVWVCTKPLEANIHCRDDKAQWLERHFPELVKKLILAPDKSLIMGSVLLDDAPKLRWMQRAAWKPVIFDAPFNREGSEWESFPRWSWGQPLESLLEHM